MNSRSNSYWEARTNSIMDKQQLNADIANIKLRKAYIKALSEIEVDIRKIYNKLKKNGELSDKQTKELLNTEISRMDRRTLRRLRDNTKDEKIRKFLTAKLDAPAYAARIARRESLRDTLLGNINNIMNGVAFEENKIDRELFIKNMNESYYTHMYEVQKGMQLGFDVGTLSNDTIEAILKRPFIGSNYSQRIWGNTEKLTDQLYETILAGFLNGKPLKKMISELIDTMGVGESAARRLIKTESAYYTNMAAIEGYKECEIEKYRYFAKLDLKVSNICRELDGKIFDLDKAIAGETLPPMHPWCRSSIGPVIYGVAQRIGVRTRDVVTGKSEVIKGDITYKEWYDKYVVDRHGKDKADQLEKRIKNKSNDKKQFEKYKELIGKDSPKSLKEFQEIKYNNSKEWNLLNNYKKSMNKGMISVFSSFSDFKKYTNIIENDIVGMTTCNGIKINSQSNHFIERVLGTSYDPEKKRPRDGIDVKLISYTLANPLEVKEEPKKNSHKFIGENVTITVNPISGNLIQCNPTDSDLVRRLKNG